MPNTEPPLPHLNGAKNTSLETREPVDAKQQKIKAVTYLAASAIFLVGFVGEIVSLVKIIKLSIGYSPLVNSSTLTVFSYLVVLLIAMLWSLWQWQKHSGVRTE